MKKLLLLLIIPLLFFNSCEEEEDACDAETGLNFNSGEYLQNQNCGIISEVEYIDYMYFDPSLFETTECTLIQLTLINCETGKIGTICGGPCINTSPYIVGELYCPSPGPQSLWQTLEQIVPIAGTNQYTIEEVEGCFPINDTFY